MTEPKNKQAVSRIFLKFRCFFSLELSETAGVAFASPCDSSPAVLSPALGQWGEEHGIEHGFRLGGLMTQG